MKTMKTFSRRIAALLLVVTVGITAPAPAAASAANIQLPGLPKNQCVADDAGVLGRAAAPPRSLKTLNAQLSSSCDGARIGVLTVDYTGSATTEDYAMASAINAWGIGSSSKNNGVLILLVMQLGDASTPTVIYDLTYGDGFRSTLLADQASLPRADHGGRFRRQEVRRPPSSPAHTNAANTIAEVYGVTLSGGTIYSDGSDTQTTRPSVEPVPPQKHYSIWEKALSAAFSPCLLISSCLSQFSLSLSPLSATPSAGSGDRLAGSAHGGGAEARALPAALTMTSAPAVVSMAALVDLVLPAGLGLPGAAASVEAALAVWAAAEPGAAAAASAAWAAAAATAAEPDADADIMTKGKPHLTVGLPFCLFCYLMQLEQGL